MIDFLKRNLLLIVIVAQAMCAGSALAAEGDLLWSKDSSSGHFTYGIDVDSGGVYAVGTSKAGGWMIEKRNSTNGDVLWTKELAVQGEGDAPMGVMSDGNFVYIVGTINFMNSTTSASYSRIEKRSVVDGSLIWGKQSASNSIYIDGKIGGDGFIYALGWDGTGDKIDKISPSDGSVVKRIAINSNGFSRMIIEGNIAYLGGYKQTGCLIFCSGKWQMQKIDLSSGVVGWNVTDADFSEEWWPLVGNTVQDVTADSSGVYFSGNSKTGHRMEKRNKSNGSIIWTKAESSTVSGSMIKENGGLIYNSTSGNDLRRVDGATGNIPWSKSIGARTLHTIPGFMKLDSSAIYLAISDRTNSSNEYWVVQKYANNIPITAAIVVSPNVIDKNQLFSINASASTGPIAQVRFLLDDTNSSTAPLVTDVRWSIPYSWTVDVSPNWSAVNKTLSNQTFISAGTKKVWAEISDASSNKVYASAPITVNAPTPCAPTCIDDGSTCSATCGGGTKTNLCTYADCTTGTISVPCNTQVCTSGNDKYWKEVTP